MTVDPDDTPFEVGGRAAIWRAPSGASLEAMAPTRLYVDLATVQENLAAIRGLVGPEVAVMAMVKALGYGTDAVHVGLALRQAGVDRLGVASADEGVALRRAGIDLPIVVMLGTAPELAKMVEHDLTPMIYSPEMFAAVRALDPSVRLRVHVEVDTGFHRAGFPPDEAVDVVRTLDAHPGVEVEGVMTHLACADDPDDDTYTALQLDRFDAVVSAVESAGIDVVRHAAATAGSIRVPRARYDMVRIGLGLYGLHPSAATAAELDLTPAIALVSRLVQVIDVPPTERVGYGGVYVAPDDGGRVGVVPVGYHDGVPRALSNFGHVVIDGVDCPIAGTVSMDSMTVDLTGCPSATVGSDVLILGRRGDDEVAPEAVAGSIGTISYELMARLGPRVQRILVLP